MKDKSLSRSEQYETISRAIQYIRQHAYDQPTLKQIADATCLSEFHLQRIFSSWAGVSPKRFLQFITKEHALKALRDSKDVLSAALETGLSGAGRLHDLMVTCEAMTPGEIKSHGAGLDIQFGHVDTPFGTALIAWTLRGLCHLEFYDGDLAVKESAFKSLWVNAQLTLNDEKADQLSKQVFSAKHSDKRQSARLHLLIRGTNFQLKVWEALLKTSRSEILSYSQLAKLAGSPNAQRAVGTALAANRIAFLIPCHRVIKENGDSGRYRWGGDRKLAIQAWEAGSLESS